VKNTDPPADWLTKLNLSEGPIRRRRYHAKVIEAEIVLHLVGMLRSAAASEKVLWRELRGVTWSQVKDLTVSMLREVGWGLPSATRRASPLIERARVTVQNEFYQHKRGGEPMSNEALTLDQIRTNPIPIIEQYLAEDPDLWWGGKFNWHWERRRDAKDGLTSEARLALRRQITTEPHRVAQLIRAAEFIDQAPRIKSLNRSRGTYGWKHVAERYQKHAAPDADYYVGEGMFIMAARAMGLTLSPNGYGRYYVSLSEKAAEPFKRVTAWVPSRVVPRVVV
jgi:hypothetical protein